MNNSEQHPPRCGKQQYKYNSRSVLPLVDLRNYRTVKPGQLRQRRNNYRTGGLRRNG